MPNIKRVSASILLVGIAGCAILKPRPAVQVAGGVIAEDTVWQGTIEVVKDVVVLPGVKLRVEPGAVIRFKKSSSSRIDPRFLFTDTELIIQGSLSAEGTPEQPILFTSAEDQPQMGDWAGIILDRVESSLIKRCHIEFAKVGIYCINSSPRLEENGFSQNKYGIICQLNSLPHIQQNEISAGEVGIACWDKSAPKIMANRIYDNQQAGILWGAGATPWFENNLIEGNRYGIFGGEEYIWTTNRIEHNEYDFYLSPQAPESNQP
jgi:hypothetical protein